MSERHILWKEDRVQEQPKEAYAPPELTRHGTVVELTQQLEIPADIFVGSDIRTDTAASG
jgi:hypothetical protein